MAVQSGRQQATQPTGGRQGSRGDAVPKRVVAPALVGRVDELELLASAVSEPPAVVVVEGEAGVGKTRLVSELLTRPEISDRRVLTGFCRRIREPFPLGPVVEALRGAGDDLRVATLSPVAGALRPLLPELAHLLPAQPAALDDRAAERHRVFRGLVEVLGSLGPAVVVLEDVHWVDEHSVEFLSYLLDDPPPKLSLVLTFRGDEVHPEVRALTSKLPESLSRAHAVLVPLDAQQTGALAASVLGVDRVSEEFSAYLCERTGGLPFAVEELLALLQARGKLRPRGSGWARRTLDELDVPTGIRDQVLERVSRLSPDARTVAEAAAVLQTPMSVDVIVATALVPPARARRGLGESLDSGVLVESDGGVGLRHLLAAQAVYESIPTPRRQDLHSRAVAALGEFDSPPLGQVAYHLQQAGRVDEWVQAAEKAADQALEFGHEHEAARLLEDVLRHAPLETDQRGGIALKLGRAAVEAGRGRYVLDLLSDVLAGGRDLPPAVRGELRVWLAMLLDQTGGDVVRMHRLLSDAVDELGDQPNLKAWAMVSLGLPTTPGVALSEHLSWLHRSLELMPQISDSVWEVFLLGKVSMVLVSVGDREWRQVADRMMERTGGTPEQRRDLNAYYSTALEACYAGHHEVAAQLVASGLKGAAICESPQPGLLFRSVRVLLDYCRGSWDGLGDQVERMLDELDEFPRYRTGVEVVAGCLALANGDLDKAHHWLVDVVQRLEALGAYDVLPMSSAAMVRLAIARGEANAAVEGVDRFLAVIEPKEIWAVTARALPTLAQALVVAGEVGRARALIGRFARELRDLDAPIAPAALAYARGFLDGGTEQWLGAARHFLAAVQLYERLQCPYEAAQAREQAAVSLFAASDATAEETMRAALASYQQLGATWDWGRAAGIARQHGVEVARPWRGGRRGYGDQLSPRELQVAELAAMGRTNKEIAHELYLSPKTVEVHLKAVRRKLGVRSRAAIGRRLAEASADVHVKNTQFT